MYTQKVDKVVVNVCCYHFAPGLSGLRSAVLFTNHTVQHTITVVKTVFSLRLDSV